MTRPYTKLDTVTIAARAIVHGGVLEDLPEESQYTVFELKVSINGVSLTAGGDDLIVVDDCQLWLAQRYNGSSWLLTCTCGEPGCAGFFEPVASARRRGLITWTFPKSYFGHLRLMGLATGVPRQITFTFSAHQVFTQFEEAQRAVRQHEAVSNRASGFLAGCICAPAFSLDEQFAQAHAFYMRRHKRRRYARHIGLAPGLCAGLP